MGLKKQIIQLLQVPLKGFQGIISLLYPQCCCVCNEKLVDGEKYLCLDCSLKMPLTNYHLQPENGAADRLKGKIPYEKAAAFLYYNKGGVSQKIVKAIKYKGNTALGQYMGFLMSQNIRQSSSFFDGVDLLIPIPLHLQKQKKRGFNQSEEIVKGISESTGIPFNTDLVIRKKQTKTQTKKGRYARWLNTIDVFTLNREDDFDGKHILIVDDVLTTGATIEACAQAVLSSYPNVKISVLTLAVTE